MLESTLPHSQFASSESRSTAQHGLELRCPQHTARMVMRLSLQGLSIIDIGEEAINNTTDVECAVQSMHAGRVPLGPEVIKPGGYP